MLNLLSIHQTQRLEKFVLILTLSWNLLLHPKFFRRNRPACLLRKTHLWLRRLRLIWSRLLLVSQRLIYSWREIKEPKNFEWITILTILAHWNCYLLWLKLYANLNKVKEFSNLNLINFIVNTLNTHIHQHLHSYNSMIIYIDGLRQFGHVL